MKRTLIGSVLVLAGTLLLAACLNITGGNMAGGCSTPPGRFLTTVYECGIGAPMFLGAALLALGLAALCIEYFKKES